MSKRTRRPRGELPRRHPVARKKATPPGPKRARLSAACRQRIAATFSPKDRETAVTLLREAPALEGETSQPGWFRNLVLDRCRGSLGGLRNAIALGASDYRDLILVNDLAGVDPRVDERDWLTAT